MTEKFTPFLNEMNSITKNVKITRCDNTGKRKALKENCENNFKKIVFNLSHQELDRKMMWYNNDLPHFIPECK